MYSFIKKGNDNLCVASLQKKGQASVEGAFLIPIIFILLLLLLQPSILLFDRIVMKNAASEGCRLLATKTAVLSEGADPYEEYVLSRLSSIPEEDHFHVHKSGCSWEIVLSGNESSSLVSVQISHKVKPLPLIDFASRGLGITDGEGFFEVTVEAKLAPKNDWVLSNEAGNNPADWVKQWE